MQSWSEVRLGLMALGCRRILHVEIVCKTCGVWRGALYEEQDIYPCPQCRAACTLDVVVEGFSRHVLPPWEKRAKGLSDKAREWIMGENFLDDRSHLRREREIHTRNRLYRGQTVTSAR